MKVYKLTIEQNDQLIGQQYNNDSYFYPIQDINDNWIIGDEEVKSTIFDWVKDLPIIEFKPKID